MELHPAIEHLAQPGHFEPDGAPAAALFEHARGAAAPTHRAGRPSPEVAAIAAEAADAARERLGYARRDGNPLLPALALAAFYLGEARASTCSACARRRPAGSWSASSSPSWPITSR